MVSQIYDLRDEYVRSGLLAQFLYFAVCDLLRKWVLVFTVIQPYSMHICVQMSRCFTIPSSSIHVVSKDICVYCPSCHLLYKYASRSEIAETCS